MRILKNKKKKRSRKSASGFYHYTAVVKFSYQPLAVEQRCPAVAVCGPLGEADHMVQVFSQSVDILLLLFQTQLVIFRQRLGTQVYFR